MADRLHSQDDQISQLSRTLNTSTDIKAAARAARELGSLGTPRALEALERALNEQGVPAIRYAIAGALAVAGQASDGVVTTLVHALGSHDAGSRDEGREAIKRAGGRVCPVLSRLLETERIAADDCAYDALVLAGGARVEIAMELMLARSEKVRVLAVRLLPKDPLGPTLDCLAQYVNDPAVSVRMGALERIAALGPDARSLVPNVVPFLCSAEDSLRNGAAAALESTGAGVLVDMIEREYAVVTTKALGIESTWREWRITFHLPMQTDVKAHDALYDLLSDHAIGRHLLEALGKMTFAKDPQDLLEVASGGEYPRHVRKCSIVLLGHMARDRPSAVAVLSGGSGDELDDIRRGALRALEERSPEGPKGR